MKKIYYTVLIAFGFLFSFNRTQAQCISAVQLDGTDEYLHSPFNNYTFTNFTMEMWINAQTYSTNVHFISLYQNAYIVLGDYGSGLFETWADGLNPISISSATPAINTWHHVAYVYDGANQILYVDGIPVATTPTMGAVTSGPSMNSGLVIGARYTQNAQYATAIYDDVRIWNVARSQAELQAAMNTSLTGTEPGLVAYYIFEDGIGSTTVTDLTGNGNTLTLYNMDPNTDWVSGNGILSVSNVTDSITACDSIIWVDGNTYYADNNTATWTLTNLGGCDSIITLDLTINHSSTSTDVITACDSITWIDGNTYYTDNSIATWLLPSITGCDSMVSLDLTINYSSVSNISNAGMDSITVNGQTYTQSGIYTQVLTNAIGCDSTITIDLDIQYTGINDIYTQVMNVYPNPTFDKIFLQGIQSLKDIQMITITDSKGSLVKSYYSETEIIDMSDFEFGMYYIHIVHKAGTERLKVVKQ